jgi:hypothetical protein
MKKKEIWFMYFKLIDVVNCINYEVKNCLLGCTAV